MQLSGSSELMKNQKHASVMSPEKDFDVLQTPDGDSLFFSIGTDHVLYVTRQVRQCQTGWQRLDLSSSLAVDNGGAVVAVKTFALAQNPQTFEFDVALVVTVSGNDILYMSLGHSNQSTDWANLIQWTRMPFDAEDIVPPNPLTISDVYLMSITDAADTTQTSTLTCFVDVIRTPGDPFQILDRYYITPATPTKWIKHALAENLQTGSISSCLGHRTDDYVAGMYTFGSINGGQELTYVPQYNYWKPVAPPEPARLILPLKPTAIASALNQSGDTNLFVAASSGLYLYTPDTQYDLAEATLVVPNVVVGEANLFANVTTLSASTTGGQTVVWVLNAQGMLFHVDCPAGSESNPSTWTHPVPFAEGINHYSFYLNSSCSSSIVLFAYSSGNSLLQYTQQPSGEWVQRSIALPTVDVNDYIEFTSFTTRISLKDDNGSPVPLTQVMLTSEVAVSVYVDDTYYVLDPSNPVPVETDELGTITIVQETATLAGVKITASVTGPSSGSVTVDPLSKATTKLQSIKTGDDLANVTVTGDDGSQKPLVPSGVDAGTRNAAAHSLVQLIQLKQKLSTTATPETNAQPAAAANGTAAAGAVTTGAAPGAPAAPTPSPVPQPAASAAVSTSSSSSSLIDDMGRSIKVASEDFFNFFKKAYHAVSDFVVHFAEGAWHFIVRIAGDVYHAILDTVAAVVNAVEFVFKKIEVAFEDLIRWLGFLFEWNDMKRTHTVLKYMIKKQVGYIVNSIDLLEAHVEASFGDAENQLNSWANVTDSGESFGSLRKQAASVPGSDSPQSHWALYHTKNGLGNIDSGSNSASAPAQSDSTQLVTAPSVNTTPTDAAPSTVDTIEGILADLKDLLSDEIANIDDTIHQIKTQIIDDFSSLTPVQFLKRVIGIFGDLFLKTTKDMIAAALKLFKLLISEVVTQLDSPLDIPILSPIYKFITGSELTVLDLACFVSAIPTTIIFKIASGEAPYPDDDAVQAVTQGSTAWSPMTLKQPPPPGPQSTGSALSSEKSASPPPTTQAATGKLTANERTQAILDITPILSAQAVLVTGFAKYRIGSAQAKAKQKGEKGPDGPGPKLRWLSAAFYILYLAPDFCPMDGPSPSWFIENYVIACIDAAKAVADAHNDLAGKSLWSDLLSPLLECGLNIWWIVPDVQSHNGSTNPAWEDDLVYRGNLAFDAAGILSPALSPLFTGSCPEVRIAAFGGTVVATEIYAVLALAAGCGTLHG